MTSEPPDADISLDGKPAGTTNARLATTAGSHVVAIAKPGFRSETRTITIAPGQTAGVAVALRGVQTATPPPPVTQTGTKPSHLIPAMTIASGTALVGFGGVALYLGHLGSREDRYRYTRATAVGVSATLLGLGAIGAGIYLWRGRDGSGLFGVLDRNSSAVVWTGRF